MVVAYANEPLAHLNDEDEDHEEDQWRAAEPPHF